MGWAVGARAVQTPRPAALAAVRADSADPWAHFALGGVYLITRRFDSSLAELKLALDLNPNFSQAHNYYAAALNFCGRWQEGDEAARRALRLSPRDPFSAQCYGSAPPAPDVGPNHHEAERLAA